MFYIVYLFNLVLVIFIVKLIRNIRKLFWNFKTKRKNKVKIILIQQQVRFFPLRREDYFKHL